jgi:hypothetical protein
LACAGDDGDALRPCFVDATAESGVVFEAPGTDTSSTGFVRATGGGGMVLDDLDGDGHLDLLLTARFGVSALYQGHGDGTFSPVADGGLPLGGSLLASIAADLDGDSLPELILVEGASVRTFRNLADFRWEGARPIIANAAPDQPVALLAADVLGDGLVDVVVAWALSGEIPERPGVSTRFGAPDLYFAGRPDFEFEDESWRLGDPEPRAGLTFAMDIDDLDGDGLLDLHFVRDKGMVLGGPNLVLRQTGDGRFTDVGDMLGLSTVMDSMGIAAADPAGEGTTEVVISDTGYRVRIWTLPDSGAAVEQSEALGLGTVGSDGPDASWGVEWIDAENDGDPDLLTVWGSKDPADSSEGMGRPDLYLWDGEQFVHRGADLAAREAPAWRSILKGDLNEDGFEDIVVHPLVGETAIFLASAMATENHHVAIDLLGPPGNSRGLGSRVDIWYGGRHAMRRVASGNTSIHSSGPATAFFGLGTEDEVERLVVRWPDGSTTERTGLGVDQKHVIAWSGD